MKSRLACFGVLLAALLAAGGVAAAARYLRPLPPLTVSIQLPPALELGPATPIPLPAEGSLFLADDGGTTLASQDGASPHPIASLAKVMTALVTLQRHPLPPSGEGPVVIMTAADVEDYHAVAGSGGSFFPVQAGERLTERDLLYALMLPSANNIARTLGRWLDGSVTAFVADLNREAAALGLAQTHFTDPSGFAPSTVSSAEDLTALARVAFAVPAFRQIVATQTATLSDGTQLQNLDMFLGNQPGWLGIKTGWTGAAGGCLLFAVQRHFSPTDTKTVFGAVLNQSPNAGVDPAHPELGEAFAVARVAADTALQNYVALPAAGLGDRVGLRARSAWHADVGVSLEAAAQLLIVRRGMRATFMASAARPAPPGTVAGSSAGEVVLEQRVPVQKPLISWRIAVTTPCPAPSVWWRVVH